MSLTGSKWHNRLFDFGNSYITGLLLFTCKATIGTRGPLTVIEASRIALSHGVYYIIRYKSPKGWDLGMVAKTISFEVITGCGKFAESKDLMKSGVCHTFEYIIK